MENVKEIMLPDGWLVDKIDNGKIILKEDDSKPIIKWNKDKDGVEVKADGYHFIVANMPNLSADWFNGRIICEKWDGYLPSLGELKIMNRYYYEINRCFAINGALCIDAKMLWSNNKHEVIYATCFILKTNEIVNFGKNNVNVNIRAFRKP